MDKLNVGQTVLHLRFCSFSNVPKYYFGEPAQKFGMHTFHGKPDSISTKKKRSLRRKTSHHSRHPPPPPVGGGGGGGGGGRLNLQPNFENLVGGDMTGPQLLEGGCWELFLVEGGEVCNFHIKNKLKSEIFNSKKIL